MPSELLAAPPPKSSSNLSTTTTATTTTSAANGTTTTTTTITTVSANGTTTTTTTTTTTVSTTTTTCNAIIAPATSTAITAPATSTATTISSLSGDDLREIFLRLPDLPALVRAALTCRSWLGAVRFSPAFRRLFRALHQAPLIGLFLELNGPFFVPMRLSDYDVAAALRRGDFFLTSLPHSFSGWTVTDCRDGYILLWNGMDNNHLSLATLNPMTWAVDILPSPRGIAAESRRNFGLVGFHLQSSDENPCFFRVICVCKDQRRVRAVIFSSETWDWVIHPWVDIGGNNSLKFKVGSLVDGSIYWPCHGERRMIRINIDTMDITSVDLPWQVEVDGFNFQAGDTKDGELCIVYESGFFLHVWIRSMDSDGTEIWAPQNIENLSAEIDRTTDGITQDLHGFIKIMQVRSGYVHLSMACMTPAGTQHCWFFSLSLETLKLDLLLEGKYDGYAYPYVMAWPPSLVADDGSIGHDVEGSH
ncbi:uncharacterized protein [Lolium perenne]|uniref:uncharacterized protein n=1 Tax=Lolium perenne TaxID=4522 RepID=UPI0021EABA7F|nr:uncharacterized protein LOC127299312 [Lolium perenne]